jgi:xanthine dehydrogenase accessory factor
MDWVSKLHELYHSGQSCVLATLVRSEGSVPQELAAKMLILSDGKIFGTIGGGFLERTVIDKALICFRERQNRLIEIDLGPDSDQACGGKAMVLLELVNDSPQVTVFGAGHVAQALSKALENSFFSIQLVDERPEWIQSAKLPQKVQRHQIHWQEYIDHANWHPEKSYIVIMTPDHKWDLDVLKAVINKPYKYIGLMGSRNKWAKFKQSLIESGIHPDKVNKVHCPIGLPIGGNTPSEIAISIAAELIQNYHKE